MRFTHDACLAEVWAAHRPGERPLCRDRASPPGIQRFARKRSGQYDGWLNLRWNVRMGLTMNLSGMFNTGHDVGGLTVRYRIRITIVGQTACSARVSS
jgi:alpha-glucosidase (family GH31 glycosyl hydrolase)